MDEIFTAETDRFHQLRDVLKFIFESLDKTNESTAELERKMVSKFMQIDQIKAQANECKESIGKVNLVMKELEMKSITAEDDISGLNCGIESIKTNLSMQRMDIKTLKEKMKGIEGGAVV